MTVSQWIFAHFFEIAGYILAIILIPRILFERHHPGATIAWLLVIALIPFIGVPLYFLIGGKRIKRISREKDWGMRNMGASAQDPDDGNLLPGGRKIARLLTRTGMFPPAPNNKVVIIDDGVVAYTTLVRLLENARESIEIATFILGRDEVGRTIVELLARKARQGVEVRLLLDAYGCLLSRGSFVRPLKDAGGRVGVFMPMLPLRRRWSANLRNHRKMAIVDGCHSMVGGMNLAREYIGPTSFKKRWKDVCMAVKGNCVDHLRTVFWQDWIYCTGEEFDRGLFSPVASPNGDNGSIVQVVGDGPDIPERPLYSGVLAALSQARESVWVVTPYFVPDEPLSAALELAARMGCDVRLIIPERSNHPLVDLAGHSFLPDLLAAGVQFYFYQPGMLHAKLIAIDQQLAVVGSANMDIRSFQLSFEIVSFLYTPEDVRQVTRVIEGILRQSRQVSKEEVEKKSKIREFSEDICRVFSPLL
jgi:cardiolipin synthase